MAWLAHIANLTGNLDSIGFVASRVDLSALMIIIRYLLFQISLDF